MPACLESFLVGIKSETNENHFRFPLVSFSFLEVRISSTDKFEKQSFIIFLSICISVGFGDSRAKEQTII